MISKDLLREVLLEQAHKVKERKAAEWTKREALGGIERLMPLRQAIIISGVRRCGKSVLLLQIMNSLNDSYYVNFEDERLAGFEVKDFNLLYEVCLELFGKSKTFFLDEVQSVVGWEKWIRRMYDDGFKFYITGSNAGLLSKELGALLTGRHLQINLYPFSFTEFSVAIGDKIEKNDWLRTEKRAQLAKALGEYVKLGGFPEHIKNRQIEILQEYFNSIIQRDIVERYKVKNVQILKNLAQHLITNLGNLTTYNQLKTITESKSANTAINYVSYLENAYLIFRVPFFSHSIKKQTANPFKIYAIDHAMRNAVGFTFSPDAGRIYENIVALALKRRNTEIYYWKNQSHQEVDFAVKKGKKITQLIQVCYKITEPAVKKREISALLRGGRELKCKNMLIITDNYAAEEKISGKKIIFTPLWKWLLENP